MGGQGVRLFSSLIISCQRTPPTVHFPCNRAFRFVIPQLQTLECLLLSRRCLSISLTSAQISSPYARSSSDIVSGLYPVFCNLYTLASNRPSSFLSQSSCTCCHFCLDHSSPRSSQSSLITYSSAQMPSPERGLLLREAFPVYL